jgi:flavin-dependent dehydrogenase
LKRLLASLAKVSPALDQAGALPLEDGARVAVVGGGPAGTLFSTFLLRLADTAGLDLQVDVFEPRDFRLRGPAGCNHCGGVVSESLVQVLATEGVRLPDEVIQRGIDSYVLHLDVGTVRIDPPLREKRIAAVYRGNGPREGEAHEGLSFDRHLLELAASHGARVHQRVITGLRREGDRPVVVAADGTSDEYDLLVLATGINSHLLEAVEGLGLRLRPPEAVKTFITELHLGRERIERELGHSMHVFLLDLPRLEFAALIPKGDFVTCCLLGDGIDDELVSGFLSSPEVRACFPEARVPETCCHCFPRINVRPAWPPFADRVVLVGDCGVTRLYKDGIGAAYRTAKAAAATAVFHGVSAASFRRHYEPACRRLTRDNAIGRLLFAGGHVAQRLRFARRAILRMTRGEQASATRAKRLSAMLWDMFTGSAPYREVLVRGMHPSFLTHLLWNVGAGLAGRTGGGPAQGSAHHG